MKIPSSMVLVLALLPVPSVLAATLNVPQDYPTIQAAIDAAVAGDTVLVAPGSYQEMIDFVGKAITVKSSGGPDVTTIAGNQSGPMVSFLSGEGRDSLLEGFTITNGSGGISCWSSSPTIRGNQIVRNVASGGAGIRHMRSSALIEDNSVSENTGNGIFSDGNAIIRNNVISGNRVKPGTGGGVFCANDTIDHNTISGNVAEEAGGIFAKTAIITNNLISDNEASYYQGGGIEGGDLIANNEVTGNKSGLGAGIYGGHLVINNLVHHNRLDGYYLAAVYGSDIVRNTTIVDNVEIHHGGVVGGYYGNGTLVNCIVWHNFPAEIGGSPTVTYSDVGGGWPGTGNINADPQFTDWVAGDYSLAPASPCLDAGDPTTSDCEPDLAGNPRRLDGHLSGHAVVDMGAFEFDHVHLAVVGSATPGGIVTIVTTGTSGLRAVLLAGLAPAAVCVPPYGTLFLDLTGTWIAVPWGLVPSAVDVTIPSDLSVPFEIVLQEVALSGLHPVGDTSNAVALTIQ